MKPFAPCCGDTEMKAPETGRGKRRSYALLHRCSAALVLVLGAVASGCKSPSEPAPQPTLFFPYPPEKPRVQFLTWASGSEQVKPRKSALELFTLGKEKSPPQRLKKPYGIAARDGVVYVCDTKRFNIARLDFRNRAYTLLGESGPGRLRKPINIVIDDLGYKFVADPLRKQVVVFGPDDRYVTSYNIPEPCHPVDVAWYGNEIYVLDNDKTPQVVVLDRATGKVLRTFGSAGDEPGQFHIPNSLCIDPEGFVYVSDTLNFRIQKLTREGKPVWTKGTPGYRLGQFGRPRGIRAGPDGIVYVVEGAMQIVQMFDRDGNILMRFGGPGEVPGSLVLPSTLAVDRTSISCFKPYIHEDFNVEYLLFVVNQFGPYLVNVYAFGSFPEGYKLEESEIATLPPVDAEEGIGPVGHPGAEEPAKTGGEPGKEDKQDRPDDAKGGETKGDGKPRK